MDSTGEQLHPNWRALATIHLPLKRFIPEGADALAKGTADEQGAKYEIFGKQNGQEVRQFYDEIINESAAAKKKVQKQTKKYKEESKPKALTSVATTSTEPFDAVKYFRAATTNNVHQLRNFHYQTEDINCRDHFDWTALMMAACENAAEAVKVLLELGVDVEAKDKSGNMAIDLARKKGHLSMVDLLENYQTSFLPRKNVKDNLVPTPRLEPFFCATCKRTFAESTWRQHRTSTVHQFNEKPTLPVNKLQKFNIPDRNRGLKLMVKQGWDKESGLGPEQSGRLYPVKTVIRKQRTGLGIEQPSARITHFEAFDLRATQRRNSDYYRKKPRTRNDIRREKQRDWKRERRLRRELS